MIQDYRCNNCHQLLFRGSPKLLLAKRTDGGDAIEVKCPGCDQFNRFGYNPHVEVLKAAA